MWSKGFCHVWTYLRTLASDIDGPRLNEIFGTPVVLDARHRSPIRCLFPTSHAIQNSVTSCLSALTVMTIAISGCGSSSAPAPACTSTDHAGCTYTCEATGKRERFVENVNGGTSCCSSWTQTSVLNTLCGKGVATTIPDQCAMIKACAGCETILYRLCHVCLIYLRKIATQPQTSSVL